MKTFDESLVVAKNFLAIVVLLLVVFWFFGAFEKPLVPVQPESKVQCPEHTFCDGRHETVRTTQVTVTEEKVFPKLEPKEVYKVKVDHIDVFNTTIINPPKVCEPEPREIVEEPVPQGALIEYTDRSGVLYEVHSSSYVGDYYYYGGRWDNHGGRWGSQNARVDQGQYHNWQRDTRCGRYVR